VAKVSGCRHRGPGFDSRRYQIFWVAVCLERGPLSLLSINEELLETKNSGSGLENWDYRPWGFRCADHATSLYPQKLALKFADQWRSLSRYSSLADSKPLSFLLYRTPSLPRVFYVTFLKVEPNNAKWIRELLQFCESEQSVSKVARYWLNEQVIIVLRSPRDIQPKRSLWRFLSPGIQGREVLSKPYVRFEVFTAVIMKNGVFLDVTPCGSCKSRRFGGT
jgi:hypothetical protein